ncbi:hypothetical protein [Pseudobacteriovorax antillogorgiicola]|nr:hypothetical protein [Pseudobacteriovorax antillogorgiicola]
MSLEDLDIQMGTGQTLDQNTMDIIAENGMEIDQTCQWAQLPFRYQFEEGVVYINSAKTLYNFFSYDVVKSRRCSVKNAKLSNGTMLFDRESASAYILNSKAQVARDFAVTIEIEEKLARYGTQVTQDCQFASRPFIYRFDDGYVYLPQNRSVARIYPTSSVPAECRSSDNIRMQP